MELPGSNIKKFLIFRLAETRKKFFIFQETENGKPEKLIIFREMEIFNPSSKNKKIHPEKISHTSGNGNPEKNLSYLLKRKLFLYFWKRKPQEIPYSSGNGNPKNLLILQEITFRE